MKNLAKTTVTMMFLLALFFSVNVACNGNDDPIEPDTTDTTEPVTPTFIFGADLSYVNQIEDHGGIYKLDNTNADPFATFAQKGTSMVRVRIWHNPDWVYDVYDNTSPLYSGYDDVEKTIQRAKENGMQVNLDFHYSDNWADPEKQAPPKAWANITSITVLADSVYNYTYATLDKLQQKNLLPEMVQIGNETNCGIMHTSTNSTFPKLSVCDNNWANFGTVVRAGIKAVRDIEAKYNKTISVALHVADPKNLEWWFDGVIGKANVKDFEIIGFSYYPLWHTTISYANLPALVSRLKTKYNRKLVILETAYPYTKEANDNYNNLFGSQTPIAGFAFTPEGHRAFLIDLTQKMKDAGCSGIMYWEPAWITSQMKDQWGTGSAWENCTFFNYSGNATNAFDYMQYQYTK
jgi:arabinogalactan endo-1,4-beta-galactosidase